MKLNQRFCAILSVVLACMLGSGSLLFGAFSAQATTVPTPELSYEIPVNPYPDLRKFEVEVGTFAWQTFVALNWPANSEGSPLTSKTIGQAPDRPRVWESYKTPEEVFNSEGKSTRKMQNIRFTEINSNETLQRIQRRALSEYKENNPSQESINFFGDRESVHILEEGSKPLVDRKGNYILNEARMNPVEVAQIKKNKWYDAANLKGFNNENNPFALMCSAKDPNGAYPSAIFSKLPCAKENGNDSVGTIELKAAWMVLPESVPKAISSKYYTTTRTFSVETPENYPDGDKTKVTVPVALVGFHIAQKTSLTGWVWATFEHIDNAPDQDNLPEWGERDYNLYSSTCEGDCVHNKAYVKEPYLWKKEFPHAVTILDGCIGDCIEKQIPSQITRLISITPTAEQLNSAWQAKLNEEVSNSIWKNYQLIGVQWLQTPTVPYQKENRGEFPEKLANVTLEPYVQKKPMGSSCVTCHTFASLPVTPKNWVHSDFSFLLEYAKGKSKK